MTYSYAKAVPGGFLGVLCSDPACEHPLYESATVQPEELAAEFAASDEWQDAVQLVAALGAAERNHEGNDLCRDPRHADYGYLAERLALIERHLPALLDAAESQLWYLKGKSYLAPGQLAERDALRAAVKELRTPPVPALAIGDTNRSKPVRCACRAGKGGAAW